ncbi:MAG TPA: hypothetical protein PLD28_01740 [Candidatus Cloacimonas sp.]|nr:hypothetical protein [Candidatus Cloacimonas sp.]
MDNRERASALIEELETLQPDLYGKDFLLTWENCFDNLSSDVDGRNTAMSA